MSDDLYKTLQVDPEADPEVIQAAYRRLARKYHPDVSATPEAAQRMRAINDAWAVLGDPVRRAEHDRARGRGTTISGATPAATHDAGSESSTYPGGSPPAAPGSRSTESVSRDWTSGRSTVGSGYDPTTMRAREGFGAAGPPPGNPSGTVLSFGRYAGWSLGEVGRRDVEYIEWLDRVPIGRPYREEIDALLRKAGRRRSAEPSATEGRGLFRRR